MNNNIVYDTVDNHPKNKNSIETKNQETKRQPLKPQIKITNEEGLIVPIYELDEDNAPIFEADQKVEISYKPITLDSDMDSDFRDTKSSICSLINLSSSFSEKTNHQELLDTSPTERNNLTFPPSINQPFALCSQRKGFEKEFLSAQLGMYIPDPAFGQFVPASANVLSHNNNCSTTAEDLSLDDVVNTDMFERMYGDCVRFNYNTKKFYIWNGKVWAVDEKLEVKKMAENVVVYCRDNIKNLKITSDEQKKSINRLANSNCFNSRITAIVEMLKHRKSISQIDFNRYPSFLNVNNGVVDLKSGCLLEHDQNLLLSKICSINFIPNYDYSRSDFYNFLFSICGGDTSLMDYIQVAFGYGITGETKEQILFLLQGSGSNGKTTLIEAIGKTVSEYVSHIPVEILIGANDARSGAKATPELVAAAGSRILFSSESNPEDVLNEGKIKQLTGEGTIPVRQLYCEPFEIEPTFKIFMDTNHLPKIKGRDFAIWRRIKVIPFNITFSGNQVNKFLPQRLHQVTEQQAIISWLVEGAVKYYNRGIIDVPAVSLATNDYRLKEDNLSQFINCHIEKDTVSCVSASELYDAFSDYCNSIGSTPTSQTAFGNDLKALGFEKRRSSGGNIYCGIKLK